MNSDSIALRMLRALAPAVALGAAALLLVPAGQSFGFVTLGTALNVGSERDWRVFDDFADAEANANTTPDAGYPGYLGATQALWKAAAEWGSLPHGTGGGDPTQALIGNGGANFDFFFGGQAADSSSGSQIVSTVSSCSPGVFAYTSAGGNAWSIRFCDDAWIWSDAPDGPLGGEVDIQGIGCHEFGHALGLGHSAVADSTMFATTITGLEQRSLESDDRSGVQAIYGAMDPGKPIISAVQVDFPGNKITIAGSNFSSTGNEVWFASSFPTASNVDPRVIVTGVTSLSGTSMTLSLPATAGDGDVHVRNNLTGGKGLSNGWPVDLMGATGPTIEITAISPTTVECLVPGTAQTVTIHGSGFSASTTVTIDGAPLDSSGYTVVDSQTITLDMPQVSSLGAIGVQVDDGALSASSTIQVVAPTGPLLQVGNGLGFLENQISSSTEPLDVYYAGPPGAFHYVLVSSSNLPSSIPIVSLCIGNGFSDLDAVTSGVIGAAGYNELHLPLLPVFGVFFFQSISFSQGTPLPASNCQEMLILF